MAFTSIIPDDGVLGYSHLLLDELGGGGHDAKIHLYTNVYTPTRTTVLADFVEATAGGLIAQPLPVPVSSGVNADGQDIWTYPQTVFTATGPGLPEVLYGYWIDFLDPLDFVTRVIQAQRFTNPQVLIAAGNTIKFYLSFGVKQC